MLLYLTMCSSWHVNKPHLPSSPVGNECGRLNEQKTSFRFFIKIWVYEFYAMDTEKRIEV